MKSPSSLLARIAQLKVQAEGKYMTTETSCLCPDHQYRHRVCKHMRDLIARNEMKEAEDKVEEMNRFFAGEKGES